MKLSTAARAACQSMSATRSYTRQVSQAQSPQRLSALPWPVRALLSSVLVLCAAVTQQASAADRPAGYPAQPVRVIVPFPPGGTSDIVGRVISQRLATSSGQRFLVEAEPEQAAQPLTVIVNWPALLKKEAAGP